MTTITFLYGAALRGCTLKRFAGTQTPTNTRASNVGSCRTNVVSTIFRSGSGTITLRFLPRTPRPVMLRNKASPRRASSPAQTRHHRSCPATPYRTTVVAYLGRSGGGTITLQFLPRTPHPVMLRNKASPRRASFPAQTRHHRSCPATPRRHRHLDHRTQPKRNNLSPFQTDAPTTASFVVFSLEETPDSQRELQSNVATTIFGKSSDLPAEFSFSIAITRRIFTPVTISVTLFQPPL